MDGYRSFHHYLRFEVDVQHMKSLTQFFDQNEPATLETCDSEKIHLSGRIQSIGAMLVIDPSSHTIIGACENAGPFFGTDAVAMRFDNADKRYIIPLIARFHKYWVVTPSVWRNHTMCSAHSNHA